MQGKPYLAITGGVFIGFPGDPGRDEKPRPRSLRRVLLDTFITAGIAVIAPGNKERDTQGKKKIQ